MQKKPHEKEFVEEEKGDDMGGYDDWIEEEDLEEEIE